MATRRLARYLAATLISAALAGTLEVGLAELCKRSESLETVRTGMRLTPDDAAGWQRLAAKASDPESRIALETAARLNPHNSPVWIELGLRAEAEGHLNEARRYLNRAIEVDRGYLPLWTLANFHVRHGDEAYSSFLRQALHVALIGAQDPTPVFDLAWQATADAPFILANVVGTDPAALRLYVPYLNAREHTDALIAPALALTVAHNADDRPLLLDACESLLTKTRERDALTLWNRLRISTLDPPSQRCFDWKFNSSPDHSIDFPSPAAGARIECNGSQPDTVDLLRQIIPVAPGQRYTLRWQAKTTSPARLTWILSPIHFEAPFARADIASTPDWTNAETLVTIPANVHFASLVLRLERRIGEQRFSGVAAVRTPTMQHAE